MTLAVAGLRRAKAGSRSEVLFDGKTLDGWTQIENSATSITRGGITDVPALAARLESGADPLSSFLHGRVSGADLAKELNQVIAGPSIYDPARFAGIELRPETRALLAAHPTGYKLARLNKLLLEDAYPALVPKSATTGWEVKDGAMASTGAGRGVIYTTKDYGRFRLTFTMRHVSGNPDHQAAVLIFCTRPRAGEVPLDALAGIQMQVPNGGHWDYRPGKNNNGGAEFTSLTKTRFDPHQWSRVEIVAGADAGTARMRVAQPVGSELLPMLEFKDPAAGKAGPIAWQMHNAGLFDEFKDMAVEAD